MSIKSYDKQQSLDVIYSLAKERKVKIGDLEKEAGVSAGYLSRLGKEDNNSVPSVETIFKMAQVLGVTTDYLLQTPSEGLNDREKQVLSFLDKLMQDTLEGRIGWIIQPRSLFYNNSDSEEFIHPLFFKNSKRVYDEENDEWCFIYRNIYDSQFSDGKDTEINGDCYYATLKNIRADIYLMQVGKKIFEEGKPRKWIAGYEIYLVPEDEKANPVCCTYNVPECIEQKINDLFQLVSNKKSGIMLTKTSENLLERYLNI